MLRAVGAALRPQGPGSGDHQLVERVINVVTCLPFLVLGRRVYRQRTTPEGRLFGASLISMGLAATAYHGSPPSSRARAVLRKLDYYTISFSSACLARALLRRTPLAFKNVPLLALPLMPFRPTAVTSLGIGIMEARYAAAAAANAAPHLRGSYARHLASGLAGLACFASEETTPAWVGSRVAHAAWHVLAAHALASADTLLEHEEAQVVAMGAH